jgi:hypothetical protein
MGRPITYNETIAKEICRQLSSTNLGINKLCEKNPDWPSPSTVFEWRITYRDFSELYDSAKRNQIEVLISEIVEISDDISNDEIENDKGNRVCNSEYIARSRLKIDTRKWIASKLAPKIYGEKVQNETTLTIKHEDALKDLE